jgi:FG-GAP-like repeat/Ig-like domain CHU_C associated
MRLPLRSFVFLTTTLLAAAAAEGATFIVPTDREMVRRADAIVVAAATKVDSRLNMYGGIETVTVMSVEETIKGNAGAVFDVHEPGGVFGEHAMVVPGAPRFRAGDRAILFLTMTPQGDWAVTDLVLGKFRLTKDTLGRRVAVRDELDVIGWDPNGQPHTEIRRSADEFLDFIRAEAKGMPGRRDYVIDRQPLADDRPGGGKALTPSTNAFVAAASAFSGTSYTFDVGGGRGARWNVFPSGVSFFANASGEPGAPGNGFTAVQTALGSWTNDASSNINYVYGGTDSTHTAGLTGPDGVNTVLFERDLSRYGAPAFTCTSNSYGGTLGVGGVTTTSGTNTLSGETFYTTTEGDVEMNRGIANCTLLLSSGDWNSAVTHEVGHTLGFRHSDQTRADNPSVPCSSDPTLECSSSAIMTATITRGLNAALQTWDRNAAAAVYPGTSPPSCTPPAVTSGPTSQTINAGGSATLSVTFTGTAPVSFQWYIGTSGNTASPIAGETKSSITVSPAATTSYWVRLTNNCGSANSPTATVTVNPPPPPPSNPQRRRWDFDGDGHDDIMWRNPSNGQNVVWEMNGPSPKAGAFIQTASTNVILAAAADFNGDGRTDLLWRDQSTGANYMWLMNGFSIIGGGQTQTVDPSYVLGAAIDLNNDAKADLVWHNNATGQNVVYLMNGITVVSSSSIQSTTSNLRLVGSADFNGDGNGDLFWRDPASGANFIWLMNGFTVVTTAQLTTVDPAYFLAAAIDFDANGKADVLWHNDATGQSVMWLMNGTTPAAGAFITTVTSAFKYAGAGDFDGNGTGDILWHNPTTGQNAIWLMNGFTVVSMNSVTTTTVTFNAVIPRGR